MTTSTAGQPEFHKSQAEIANNAQRSDSMRSALIVASVVAVALVLLTIVSWFLFEPLNKAFLVLAPLTSAVIVLVGILLVRQGKIVAGISLSLIALALAYLFLITQFGGIGVLASIVFTLVAASAILETYPPTYVARFVVLALVFGFILLLLDLFWPGTRRPAVPSNLVPVCV